jgi:hypothetical protein
VFRRSRAAASSSPTPSTHGSRRSNRNATAFTASWSSPNHELPSASPRNGAPGNQNAWQQSRPACPPIYQHPSVPVPFQAASLGPGQRHIWTTPSGHHYASDRSPPTLGARRRLHVPITRARRTADDSPGTDRRGISSSSHATFLLAREAQPRTRQEVARASPSSRPEFEAGAPASWPQRRQSRSVPRRRRCVAGVVCA